MKWLVYSAAVALAILHQDWWYWASGDLVGGFIPIGLAYHMLFSVLAALVWAAAVKWAWPSHIEAWADEVEDQGQKAGEAK